VQGKYPSVTVTNLPAEVILRLFEGDLYAKQQFQYSKSPDADLDQEK
jgi:hypothetical protein